MYRVGLFSEKGECGESNALLCNVLSHYQRWESAFNKSNGQVNKLIKPKKKGGFEFSKY